MLIGLLTSILIAVVFMAGGLFAETHDLVYIAVGGLIAAIVGVLYGYISLPRQEDAGFELPHGAYSLRDVVDCIGDLYDPALPVYVASNGVTPISSMFLARLNGGQALVLEGADPVVETITVHRPLFEKAE